MTRPALYLFLVACSMLGCERTRSEPRPSPRPMSDVVALPASTIRGRQPTCPADLVHVDREWLAQERSSRHVDLEQQVAAFEIERRPATLRDYEDCIAAGACTADPERLRIRSGEPGTVRVGITFENAERLCAWRGGRLPTLAELQRAIRGPASERWHSDSIEALDQLPRVENGYYAEATSPDGVHFYLPYAAVDAAEWTASIGCGAYPPYRKMGDQIARGPAAFSPGSDGSLYRVRYGLTHSGVRCVVQPRD